MTKIGEFIYSWGNGHYTRMTRLNQVLEEYVADADIHYSSKDEIYEKLLKLYPNNADNIHRIAIPTPIDGKMGPDLFRCLLNITLPIGGMPPLIRQIVSYLREERRIFNEQKFDIIISDGDMGANVLAKNRNIPSLFITNQFRPKLWASRAYFYPGLEFISKQIAKASHILVADSPPPYTLSEFNLNLSESVAKKTTYVGHFTTQNSFTVSKPTDLEMMTHDVDFGYWMRTGNKSTNDGTGSRYQEIFAKDFMASERRIVSHARQDPSIDGVLGRNGKRYTISEAYEKKVDWLQIDVGFLSEQEKNNVLERCAYAVINGSHTVMGEILGQKRRPVIGIPVYDEHTNNLRWAEQKGLGILAKSPARVISAIKWIRDNTETLQESLNEFGKNFLGDGARNTAKIAAQTLDKK